MHIVQLSQLLLRIPLAVQREEKPARKTEWPCQPTYQHVTVHLRKMVSDSLEIADRQRTRLRKPYYSLAIGARPWLPGEPYFEDDISLTAW